jgi:hypothetical protein
MGYYSGTSTGPNDLIDKFRIAALAEGFTVNDFSAVGAGYRLHIQKAASDATVMYFNFRSAIAETGTTLITEDNYGGANGTVTGLIMNGSTGYDAGELWHKQPGYPQNIGEANKSFGVVMTPMSTTAIPAYYFYFVGDSVHIVVEITAGKFQFMSFGMLVKQGTYTGGQYFTGSMSSRCPNYDYAGEGVYGSWYSPHYFAALQASGYSSAHGAVYVNADATEDWRVAQGNGNPEIRFPCVAGQQANITYSQSGLCSFFWSKAPNAYNAMAAMCPIYVLLERSDSNYSLIGWPEGVRFLNCTNYDPAEEVVYGDETWMVFHADSQEAAPLNMYCGFAFLKDE